MKIKINRRMVQIGLICFAAALGMTLFMYHTLEKAAQPEAKEEVAYFKYNIDKDTILKDEDIAFIPTPKSLVPRTAIKKMDEIKDKRLIINAEAGDMVLSGKLIERGDVRVDVKKLWSIGIDVKNISNFLGGNLKEGGDYILLYITPEQTQIVSEIKIANMVDSTGKLITETGDGLIKTVNVSVKDEATMLDIASKQDLGTFEIVNAPEGYKVEKPAEQETEVQAPVRQ